MKVEVNDKTYCVETLIADNERLRKDVIASADTISLVLDSVRAEIMKLDDINPDYPMDRTIHISRNEVLQIIDKYRNEVNE